MIELLKLRFEIEFVFENGQTINTIRGYKSQTELENDFKKDVIEYRESDGMVVKIFKDKLNAIRYKEV